MPVIAGRASDISLLGWTYGYRKLELVFTLLAFIFPFSRYFG